MLRRRMLLAFTCIVLCPSALFAEESISSSAQEILNTLEKAYARIKSDMGDDVFDRIPSSGDETIGTIWGRYLKEAGYPSDFKALQMLGIEFIGAGMDDSAVEVMISRVADRRSIEYLIEELRRIAKS